MKDSAGRTKRDTQEAPARQLANRGFLRNFLMPTPRNPRRMPYCYSTRQAAATSTAAVANTVGAL